MQANSAKKILFFVESISYGHIARSLIISQWLRELNPNIVIACPPSSRTIFDQAAFEIEEINITSPAQIYQRLCQGDSMYVKENLLTYFREDDLLIQKIKPQLIISDFRFTALQLAKKYSIPGVAISEVTCHPSFQPLGTVPDSLAKPDFAPLWLLDFISQKTPMGKMINKQKIAEISIPYQEASREYGMEILPSFFHYASQGDLCLICDHPDLIPLNSLRSGDIFTGAVLWKREDSLPPELVNLNPEQKIVYISLGTQDSLSTDFLENYIQLLLQENLQVIVSLGKRNLTVLSQNDNLWVFDFINDSKLLPLVNLMVYPGGAMSTYQGIACGIPLLVLPAHANQHFYAEAIVNQQLGYLLRPSRLNFKKLTETTLDLLNNSKIFDSVQRFKDKLSSFNNQKKIIERIKFLLN